MMGTGLQSRLVCFKRELNTMNTSALEQDRALRRAVLTVALANLAYFFIEFAVARRIGSVSLFAESIDFLEDTALTSSPTSTFGRRLRGKEGDSYCATAGIEPARVASVSSCC